MSVRLMSEIFQADIPIGKLELLALADFAADDGSSIYPSVLTLAKKCSQSERTTQAHLRKLEERFLAVEQPAAQHKTRRYRIKVEAVRGAISAPLARGAKPAPLDFPEVQKTSSRGADLAPDPSTEPSDYSNHQVPPVVPNPFDVFFERYPRKVGKEAARRAWAKHVGSDPLTITVVMQAVEAQKAPGNTLNPTNGKVYIPHPASWLNGARWNDEIIAAPKAAGRPTFEKSDWDGRESEEVA